MFIKLQIWCEDIKCVNPAGRLKWEFYLSCTYYSFFTYESYIEFVSSPTWKTEN